MREYIYVMSYEIEITRTPHLGGTSNIVLDRITSTAMLPVATDWSIVVCLSVCLLIKCMSSANG